MEQRKFSLLLGLLTMFINVRSQLPFTAGNLVVYRVGTSGGADLTGASTAVFLDEYTTAGVLVQSIAMPVAVSGSNNILTAAGNGHTAGVLTLSTNGQYLVLTGYNAVPGISNIGGSSSTTRPRTIGLVKYDGTVNTSTSLTTLSSGGAVRCAVSTNGTDLWACGAGAIGTTGGVHYTTLGATTSTRLNSTGTTQLRSLGITGGQLYVCGNFSSPRIGTVGTGLPTTAGQTITNLPGLPVNVDPAQFVLLDLNAGVAGPDVLYFTEDNNGIEKYSLVSGTWVSNGTFGNGSDDYRYFAAKVSGSSVTIYITRGGANANTIKGGELVSLTDASGYNGTLAATPTVLVTSVTDKTAFRGVAFAPVNVVLPVKLISFSAGKINRDVQLKWLVAEAMNFSHFEVERSMDGMLFTQAGRLEWQQNANSKANYEFTDFGVLNRTAPQDILYYRLKMVDIDGHAEYSTIVSVKMHESSDGAVKVYPQPFVNEIFLQSGVTGKVSLTLSDLWGRVVHRMQLFVRSGDNTIKILPPANLKKGIYLLKVYANDKVTSFRLIK